MVTFLTSDANANANANGGKIPRGGKESAKKKRGVS